MGITKSKIPMLKPGQLLLHTGILDYDNFYTSLEPSIKELDEMRIELNYRITELIQELKIGELWKINPDPEVLITIILTLLSVAGNGNPQKVANFIKEPPFIIFDYKLIPSSYSKIFEKFSILATYISSIHSELSSLKFDQNNITFSELIQNEIVGKAIELDYKMKEKMQCLSNVNKNHGIIEGIPKDIEDLRDSSKGFIEKILKVLIEVQHSRFSEILLHRGIQCIASNQKSPKEVVRKFWPLL